MFYTPTADKILCHSAKVHPRFHSQAAHIVLRYVSVWDIPSSAGKSHVLSHASISNKLLKRPCQTVVHLDTNRVGLLIVPSAQFVVTLCKIGIFGVEEKIVWRDYIADFIVAQPPDEKVFVARYLDKRSVRRVGVAAASPTVPPYASSSARPAQARCLSPSKADLRLGASRSFPARHRFGIKHSSDDSSIYTLLSRFTLK